MNSQILYEDNHIIIINKKVGQLVQGDKTGDQSLLELLKDLAQKQNKLILFSSHDWRIAKDFSDKSAATSVKFFAFSPTFGSSPSVLIGFPPNDIFAIFKNFSSLQR